MEEVGLRKATPEEFRPEMRRVSSSSIMDGARDPEKERQKRPQRKLGELKEEDMYDLPANSHVLNSIGWRGVSGRRLGLSFRAQTREQVALAMKRSLTKVKEMGGQTAARQSVVQKESWSAREATDVPKVPAASPLPKLTMKLPPISAQRPPLREIQGPVSLPLEILHVAEATLKAPDTLAELQPPAEKASLRPGPPIESQTEDKAATHPDESSVPSFGLVSPATVVKALSPATVTRLDKYDGDISVTVPPFDFLAGKRTDSCLVRSSDPGSEDRENTTQGTTPLVTLPSIQCSMGST